jgi:hypothetical protein
LFERNIDDFFSLHGMAHETEPMYPLDQELNLNGFRADWLLEDGTLVEAAGMMADPAYEAKIEIKRQLAKKHELRLVVVEPADVSDLSRVFKTLLE